MVSFRIHLIADNCSDSKCLHFFKSRSNIQPTMLVHSKSTLFIKDDNVNIYITCFSGSLGYKNKDYDFLSFK